MDKNEVYSYVFKGLLTQEALEKTGYIHQETSTPSLDAEILQRLSVDQLDDEIVSKARRMATVYLAIAAFENTVRELLLTRLLEETGEDWWDSCVPQGIRDRAKRRFDDETKTRWHTPRGTSLIYYTELGDLASIIQNNWQHFEAHLPTIEWAKEMIKIVERSRNVIMHSGDLGGDDIVRVGMVIRDWIKQVGV
jgi:hypothetical protein